MTKQMIELEAKNGEDPIYFTDAYVGDVREMDYAIHKVVTKSDKADCIVVYLSSRDELIDLKEIKITSKNRGDLRNVVHNVINDLTRGQE